MASIRSLDAIEIRVLGALMEKQQTTPDYYPMTTNAVIAACNQKSSREPVMELTETQVVEALDRLAADVLAWRSHTSRAERWEHRLDRRWDLDSSTKAVMTLLLLRGPQTPGELRTRSTRMHAFGSPSEVEQVLRQRSEGPDALVKELPRQAGKRENRWMHLAGDETVTAAIEAAAAEAAPTGGPRPARRVVPREVVDQEVRDRVTTLEESVARLQRDLAALVDQLGGS